MLVTVGIPVYNRIEGFERALQSVLAQSYSNLEILISNDCSPNLEIDLLARKYASADSRIQYFLQAKPLRTVNNFSFLKENAKGKYFLWLADDDWIDENYVEQCVGFLEINPDFSMACGLCCYHETETIIAGCHSSFSIEDDSYWFRLITYFRRVTLNGYLYGVLRTELIKNFTLPNQLGFDWNIIAYLCYKGKLKTLKSTRSHISKGGMSNEGSGLSNYFAKRTFFSKNFIGLSTSLNCAKNVFDSGRYQISFFKKTLLSVIIFIFAYLNTIRWDFILTKRRLVKFLNINSNGVIFRSK